MAHAFVIVLSLLLVVIVTEASVLAERTTNGNNVVTMLSSIVRAACTVKANLQLANRAALLEAKFRSGIFSFRCHILLFPLLPDQTFGEWDPLAHSRRACFREPNSRCSRPTQVRRCGVEITSVHG